MNGWRHAALALPLLSAVVAAGCGGLPSADRPFRLPSQQPTSAASVSASPSPALSPSSGPSASPTSTAPPAEEVTRVEQAVRDYYAAVNRAIQTGDLDGLRSKSTEQCGCRALTETISKLRAKGTVENGLFTLRDVTVMPVSAEIAKAFVVTDAAPGTVRSATGAVVQSIRGRSNLKAASST